VTVRGRIEEYVPMSLEKTTAFRVPPDITSPASCAVCGCRLEKIEDVEAWQHFRAGIDGQDARGCRTACLGKTHDRFGQPIGDLVPA
jgi:hypothetical protein